MQETHQGVPEEFIFGIVLPEEEFTVAAHGGLNLNHQLVVLQTSLCMRTQTHSVSHRVIFVWSSGMYCSWGQKHIRFLNQCRLLKGLFMHLKLESICIFD